MNLVRGECDNVLSDNPPVGHPGNLTVNTTNLPNSTSNNAMSPPSEPSRTPSMTSLMFAQSAAMAGYNFFFLKIAYRSELMSCPSSCDAAADGVDATSCSCGCRADVLEANAASAILDALGVLEIVYEYQASNRRLTQFVQKCAVSGDGRARRAMADVADSLATLTAVACHYISISVSDRCDTPSGSSALARISQK